MSPRKNHSGNGFRFDDPYAAREGQKYTRPIPSRELILQVLGEQGVPLAFDGLSELLGIREEEDLIALERRLNAMERDGQLLRNRRQRYCVVNQRDLLAGRVIAHPDGFGFLRPDEGGEDVFLSPREMRVLMHNDRALISIRGLDRRGRPEGTVTEVLEHNTQQVVGRLFLDNGVAVVEPGSKYLTHDVHIPPDGLNGAGHGQIVVARIVEQPGKHNPPIGHIIEVLGEHLAPGMEIEIALRGYDLPHRWPEAVLEEIAPLHPQVREEDKEGREDLRNLPLVTIDGEDARDFDDAVYCERTAKGWKLLVAIADVSHYVRPDTALDQEAYKRGTSVYFPERVIPMLPEILSNGLCSINPGEDRLCMACEMHVDREGEVYRSRFFDAVMHSHARLTYTEVARVLVDQDPEARTRRKTLLKPLQALHDLYHTLRGQRERRGAIDFDTQETKIVFGAERKIERIVPVTRNDAHKLIEECMILANTAAARFLQKNKMPHVQRMHEGPTEEKLADLRAFLGEVGLHLRGGDKPEPEHYGEVIKRIAGRPDEHLIQTVLLRSLSQAVYSPELKGHFGLALEAYTHFTSPIRRYPDLLVHRAIRHCLQGKKPETYPHSRNDMVFLGQHCSSTERRADEATRDVVSWLKCEYMQDKLGEEFEGVISGVTSFGFFVELKDIFVEGLVHVTSLGQDYFHFEAVGHRLRGERSGKVYRLGDAVRVMVARVNLDEKKVDFELAAPKAAEAPKKKSRRGGRKKK